MKIHCLGRPLVGDSQSPPYLVAACCVGVFFFFSFPSCAGKSNSKEQICYESNCVVAPWSTHKMRLLTLFYLLSSCFGYVKSSRMVIWIAASLAKVQSTPIPRPFTFTQMPRLYHPCSRPLPHPPTPVLHQGATAIQPNEILQLSEERENKRKHIQKQCTQDIIDNICAKKIRLLISNISLFRALGC